MGESHDSDILHDERVGAGFGDSGDRFRRFFSSCSKTRVLKVMKPFTPRVCSVRKTSGSSSTWNPTLARAVK